MYVVIHNGDGDTTVQNFDTEDKFQVWLNEQFEGIIPAYYPEFLPSFDDLNTDTNYWGRKCLVLKNGVPFVPEPPSDIETSETVTRVLGQDAGTDVEVFMTVNYETKTVTFGLSGRPDNSASVEVDVSALSFFLGNAERLLRRADEHFSRT